MRIVQFAKIQNTRGFIDLTVSMGLL